MVDEKSKTKPLILKKGNKKEILQKIEKFMQLCVLFYTIVLFLALGLWYGISPEEGTTAYKVIHFINVLVESYLRAILPTIGAYLAYKHTKLKYKHVTRARKISLISLSVWNLVLLLIIPSIFNLFRGFNHITMPFPFISAVYGIPYNGQIYSESFTDTLGLNGIIYAFIVHFGVQIFAFGGTFLYGRRVFCCGICAYAGHFAESFGPGLPLRKKNNNPRKETKQVSPRFQKFASVLVVIDFTIAFTLSVLMIFWLITRNPALPVELLLEIEVIRVITLDTLLYGIGFLIWGGRFYCYYCPGGVMMGHIGRLGGQQIDTNLTHCISCGRCNDACKMSIDIMAKAKKGEPVKTWKCVGCDMCVIACPTKNLRFSTNFTRYLQNSKKNQR